MTDLVVTGGSGFLGRRVVEILRSRGEGARVLYGTRGGDITDPASFGDIMNGARCVIHCAGLAHQFRGAHPSRFEEVNVRGTENVIAAAARAGVRRFVLASSVAVYGSGDGAAEGAPCFPRSPYGHSKRQAEIVAARVAESAGMELVTLRLATLYGPGDPGNIARLIGAIDAGRFVWLGRGENRKSILYVDDAARACADASVAGAPTGIFNVVAETVPMNRIVAEIERSLRRRVPRFHVPGWLVTATGVIAARVPVGVVRRAGETLMKWQSDDVYDGAAFHHTYSFEPVVRLAEGIAAEIAARRS